MGKKKLVPPRHTMPDDLTGAPGGNLFCALTDLSNEASVETFFVSPLLKELGYRNNQIKTKESITQITVSLGGQSPYRTSRITRYCGTESRAGSSAPSTRTRNWMRGSLSAAATAWA